MSEMKIERIIATIIDCVIYMFITGLIIYLLDWKISSDNSMPMFLFLMILANSFLESFLQKSIGKIITGISVITDNYTSINIHYILLRNLIKFILFPIDLFFFLFDSNGKALHDKWGNTEVIKS